MLWHTPFSKFLALFFSSNILSLRVGYIPKRNTLFLVVVVRHRCRLSASLFQIQTVLRTCKRNVKKIRSMIYLPNNGRRDRWPSGAAVAVSEDCQAVAVAAAVSHRGRRSSEQRAATFRDQGWAMAVWTAASAHGESDGARRAADKVAASAHGESNGAR